MNVERRLGVALGLVDGDRRHPAVGFSNQPAFAMRAARVVDEAIRPTIPDLPPATWTCAHGNEGTSTAITDDWSGDAQRAVRQSRAGVPP